MQILKWLLLLTYIRDIFTKKCNSMHVKSHGLDLICCSSLDPLLSTCEFSSYCRFEECSCHLSLRDDFECSLNSTLDVPFSWKDHVVNPNPLPCLEANLPNKDVPYQLNILHWTPRKTRGFLTGICELNVTSLSLRDFSPEIGLIDFQSCLTTIQSIEILLKSQQVVDMYSLIEASESLNSLRLVNVNFELWDNISPWTRTISYFHIENSSISTLPKWLALSANLQQLFISHTNLNSVSVISQLSHLRSAKLSYNKIDDMNKNILNNRDLYDLDLSHNNISSIASYTFINCPELRVLDLSYNPLTSLPYKPFAKNSKLKWLKLDGTNIHTLSTDHFHGLTSLKTLSLSKTFLKVVSPYSFLPLKSLKMLNLESSNLTKVPAAVTQNCGLTHLNLANNFLHRHSALPPETLVMLSSLSQLQIDGNPLVEFPPSLLLLSKDNSRLYRQLIQTMTTLPVWTKAPCTPYYWYLHLGNRSHAFRQLLQPWNENRMRSKSMTYCKEQYEHMIDEMQVFKDLENNSACSVSRKLRSAIISRNGEACNNTKTIVQTTCSKIGPTSPLVLFISLFSNFFLLFLLFIMTIVQCFRRKTVTY